MILINPITDYKLENIKIIFEKIKFTLDHDQKFFFVLKKTENLTIACANKLLKILEEPPTGYNFILLTKNENKVLPTIKSRCLISHISSKTSYDEQDNLLLSFFLDKNKLKDPFSFEKEL